jgi:diguanylate cyclase (GGDEF)-like protein/PAS domain S-box-containing protein
MFGWTETSVVGRQLGTLLAQVGSEHRPPGEAGLRLGDLAHYEGQGVCEMQGLRRNGESFPVEIQVAAIERPHRRTHICTIRDITDRKAAESRILHHATHDHLTGLPNRSLFHSRLDAALAEARRSGERLAVMYLDLDRFKNINDDLGHPMGDALLAAAAERLRRHLRTTDTVARLGGDEFIFVFPRVERIENALQIGHKIVEAMRTPFELLGHRLHVTASVGISLCPDHGDREEQLLKHADIALYQAKAWGKNRVRLFAATMLEQTYRDTSAEPAGQRAGAAKVKGAFSAAE